MLQRLTLKPTYGSERNVLLEDFVSHCSLKMLSGGFQPILALHLVVAAQGLEKFLTSDGRMQFVLGNELSQNDFAQISEDTGSRDALSSQQALLNN